MTRMSINATVLLAVAALLAAGAPAQGAVKATPDTAVDRSIGPDQLRAARSATARGAVVGNTGCTDNVLGANDDGSTGAVDLPFTLSFFGSEHRRLWVNNNGNVTFDGPLGVYTPFRITADTPPIIAPFLADVDTRGSGSGLVTYGATTFQNRPAFCVNWPGVGYYNARTDKTNDFQLLLVDRNDAGPGNFDIVFNYNRIAWETGSASGGSNGFGGIPAGAGYSNGDGEADHFFELPGSLQTGAFLDSTADGLVHRSEASTAPGRHVFRVSNGGSGSLAGLSRSWPDAGFGYGFENGSLRDFTVPAGLTAQQVFERGRMERTFADWSRNGADVARQVDFLAGEAEGLCYGFALSGGRFASLMDVLANGPADRGDAVWGRAGNGPSASMNLPAPNPGASGSSSGYTREMVRLLAVDWATQYSREVMSSRQRQERAFADRTSGVRALASQLGSLMRDGDDLHGDLASPANTGFALLGMADANAGHRVVAYSAEARTGGGLVIDVWDNNFPRESKRVTVHGDGTWSYDADYGGQFLNGTLSLSGSGGHERGNLSVLPVYRSSGLSYRPDRSGDLGSGVWLDVPAGTRATGVQDRNGAEPIVNPVMTAPRAKRPGGATITLPSDAGRVTLAGARPSLNVRGAETTMGVRDDDPSSALEVSVDEDAGAVSTNGGSPALSVGRDQRVLNTAGAGALTVADDGSVTARADGGALRVSSDFDDNGTVRTASLFSGSSASGESVSFTPQEVARAEREVAAAPAGAGQQGAGQQGVGQQPAAGTGSGPATTAAAPLLPTPAQAPNPAAPPRQRALTRAQKLANAIRACGKLKKKRQRKTCIAKAKKKLPAKPRPKKRK